MSDDNDAAKTNDDAPKAPEVFMRGGGTSTAKSEALYEERFQQAEQRRDVSDKEKQLARKPIEHGGAQLLSNQFTRHPEIPKAFIPLTFVDKRGSEIKINGEPVMCCADLIVGLNPTRPEELALVLVCPRCQQSSHKHQQDNQIMIRQSNKWFEFKSGLGPRTFVFEGKTFKSAGMIVQSEAFRCFDCGWRARIDNNRVWPD
jgi:hypothetical protein